MHNLKSKNFLFFLCFLFSIKINFHISISTYEYQHLHHKFQHYSNINFTKSSTSYSLSFQLHILRMTTAFVLHWILCCYTFQGIVYIEIKIPVRGKKLQAHWTVKPVHILQRYHHRLLFQIHGYVCIWIRNYRL